MTHLPTHLWINGEPVSSLEGKTRALINPATEDVLCESQMASKNDVDLAVQSAKSAQPEFAVMSADKRQACLWKLGELIESNAYELAKLESLNTGKIFDAAKAEISSAGEVYKYFAGFATKLHGDSALAKSAFKYTLRRPVGICGAIVPWNFPLLMATWKVAPALACGNTVVLKPAEQTPLTALKLGELAIQAGFPKGVLNVVPGLGEVAGEALVTHSDVRKIAFTGSTEIGKRIMQQASGTLKRVSLELGGKSPNIIFADADLKSALRGALGGIFYNKGEVCSAGSRLLVEESIYSQVIEQLVSASSRFTLGDPFDKVTRMGPLASEEQLARVMRYLELGKKEGAKLCVGGNRATYINNGKGYFVEPTIFSDVTTSMTIAQEEIFGPVLSIIPFSSPEDAVKKANDVKFGLAAGVWSQNIKKALNVAHQIEAGSVWINTYGAGDPSMPFGGFKQSGFGRDLGKSALEQYTETQAVWIDLV